MNATNTTIDAGSLETSANANDKRLSDFMRQVAKFGEESSLGRDSLPKLAHFVVKAAADGIIDATTKDKRGDDAASRIYNRYVQAESSKAVHEHSAGGTKANVSKLRQLVSLGCMTTVDGVDVMQDAFEARERLAAKIAQATKEDPTKIKLKPAYVYYVDMAREQLKSATPLSAEELEALAVKGEPDEKTVAGELTRVMKTLEGLMSGENKHGLKDSSEEVEAAFNMLKERLDAIEKNEKIVALYQAAAALGVRLA